MNLASRAERTTPTLGLGALAEASAWRREVRSTTDCPLPREPLGHTWRRKDMNMNVGPMNLNMGVNMGLAMGMGSMDMDSSHLSSSSMAMDSFTSLLQTAAPTSMMPSISNPMTPAGHGQPTMAMTQSTFAVPSQSAHARNPKHEVPDVASLVVNENRSDYTRPLHDIERRLLALVDEKMCVTESDNVTPFLKIFSRAKTEAEQALVLIVLRATAAASASDIATPFMSAFEKAGGLKLARKWLENAVEWGYPDLLVLLLGVLKTLPLNLASITDARINEPIVKLRKTAREERVKRAAQDLLKFWRNKFTEKKETKQPEKKPVAPTAPTTASSSERKGTTTTTKISVSASKLDNVARDAKPLKRRPTKRIGSGSSSSKTGGDLIGNLLQRKKEAEKKAKREASASKDNGSEGSAVAQSQMASKEEDISIQLPTIQSFHAASSSSSKKIRWADEEGKELVKVKLIESWRDMIHHSSHGESFKDAKLREHAEEKNAMRSQKEQEHFSISLAHEWHTPALVNLSEALSTRRNPIETSEVGAQTARTRKEMEYVVLDGEQPAQSPKEWARTGEPHRGPPAQIPLADVTTQDTSPGTSAQPNHVNGETEEEAALREALGPLAKSTIALLMENEDVLPQVYDEAHRNGNRIGDARVLEIIAQRNQARQYGGYNYAPYNAMAPPPPPPGYGGGYDPYNSAPRGPAMGAPHGYIGKRKAGGGAILADVPPHKRLMMKGPSAQPCMYFASGGGCKHGNACQYSHELPPNRADQYNVPGMPPSNNMVRHGGNGARFGPGVHSHRGGRR